MPEIAPRRRFALALLFTAALASPSIAWADTAAKPPAPAVTDRGRQPKELSDAVIAVAEKVSPSVVQVDVAVKPREDVSIPWLMRSETALVRGNGSGVILSSDGYILTNNHVVEDAVSITVRTRDGKILPARIKGRDPSSDLAVIKVEATGLVAAKLGDSDAARVGEWVVAVGSPLGLSYSVTIGVLSAKGRGGLGMNAIEDYLQTDASINPGNSGGPLVNLSGEVLGINSMIIAPKYATGIGFAVPSNMARRVVDQLMKNGKVTRAWLGVSLQELTPDLAKAFKTEPYAGVLISAVTSGGPAANAHVDAGDIISKVAGKPVHDQQELFREVINHDVGTTISLEVIRDGKLFEAKALLAARPDEPAPKPAPIEVAAKSSAGYGLVLKPIPADKIAELGLAGKAQTYIAHVDSGSPADLSGLKALDLIMSAGGVANPTIDQVKSAGTKSSLVLHIGRGKDTRFFVAISK
jgi:serine protease Do